jgi:hypothetical protein
MATDGITPNACENKSTASEFEVGRHTHCTDTILHLLQAELLCQATYHFENI